MSKHSNAAVALADRKSWSSGPPHPLFDELRAEGAVVWIPGSWGTLDRDGYWAVIGHQETLAVSKDTQSFTSTLGAAFPTFERPDPSRPVMMLLDPPDHTRIRAMAGRSFTPRVVARFDDWIRNVTRDCLMHIAGLDEFDLVAELAAVVPGKVIAEVMGAPVGDHEKIIEWANWVFRREEDGGQARAVEAMQSVVGYAFGLREQKRAEPGTDVVTELANASYEGDPITDSEFGAFIMLLLIAGFETTHTLIGQSMRLLLEHPDIEVAARSAYEAGKVNDLNEEFLRYVTPAMNMARHAADDIEFGGRQIRKDDMVVMWYAAANRDPRVFAEPNKFDPGRAARNHVAFGGQGSPHYCLGHALGRLEGKIVLEEFFKSGIRIETAGPAKLTGSVFINQLDSLPTRTIR